MVGAALFLCAITSPAQERATSLPPTELAGLRWTNAFFPGATYDATVPTGESLLGYPIGQRAANSTEIEKCLKAWAAAAPDRTRLVEYARSHGNLPLHYLIVTAPKNLSRLEDIRSGMAKLEDPRTLSDAEAKTLIETLVPVAWLGYTIHGDETEGSDAALAILYHLIAAGNPEVTKLLEDVVVIIDPLQNPDGRDRFLKMIAENRGTTPSVDDQSLQHTGYAPWGRGNHYLFDLNRDPLFGVHPETRGRMNAVAQWNPVLVVDAHGMGAQDTHLFSPPREPINLHFPASDAQWSRLFARDQAAAFDQHGLVYYHGEWNEGWYPGYTDAWPVFRGAVGILYEQARIAEDGVRRPEGRILSYRESVFHHVIGSMANLKTVQANGRQLLENFHAIRQRACAVDGPYAKRTFAVLPTANRARLDKFLNVSRLHGFELFHVANEFTAARVDAKHWLTFGCEEPLPVLSLRSPVLMAGEGVEVPVRLGYLTKVQGNPDDATKTDAPNQSSSSDKPDADKKEKKEPLRVGWSALPPGTEMHLRMSGLLWPEATHRLANSACVTRESVGRGQIILFATRPTFRAATLGPARLMLNAMIYGPGYGAAQPIRP